jgi:anti-sigma B factor antagonist
MAPPSELQTHHRELENGVCVVSLKGEIDIASATTLRSALVRLRQHGYRRFVLDISEVAHMDSTGLGVLLGFYRSLDESSELAIAAAPQNVLALLNVTGLDSRFAMFASVDEALARVVDVTGAGSCPARRGLRRRRPR